MRVFSSLCLLCVAPVLLAGCQSNNVKVASLPPEAARDAAASDQQVVSLTSPDQSMLSLGRGMSDGSVDIYEPGVARLDVPTLETFTPRPSNVPENSNLVIRDPSVTVYTLQSDQVAEESSGALTPMPFESAQVSASPERRYAPGVTPVSPKKSATR